MEEEIVLNQEEFNKMEKRILKHVKDTSVSFLETIKFHMLYGTKVTPKQNKTTIKSLKDFRTKNWDSKVSRNEAYKKYLKHY